MFSKLKRLLKVKSTQGLSSSTPRLSSPKAWNETWEEIYEFEKWVQKQPDAVCVDLLCRLGLRLLPTVLVDNGPIISGSGFEQTLDAAVEILAHQVERSCNLPNDIKPLSGRGFFELCEGGSGPYAGTTWHAIESCADGFGPTFMKKYLCEVLANIRRNTPEHSLNYDQFCRAVLADSASWEAWTRSGHAQQARAELMMSSLWDGNQPVAMYNEGLPKMCDYLATKGGYAHLLLLSFFDRDGA